MVMGGIVPVVNLEGMKGGDLTIDGPTLAAIFMGTVTKWNDPALAKLNPGVKLSEAAIVVVHRSDGSGTTFNFHRFISPRYRLIGNRRSVKIPRWNGRSVLAPRAMKASPTTSPIPRARSAMSSTPMPSRTT